MATRDRVIAQRDLRSACEDDNLPRPGFLRPVAGYREGSSAWSGWSLRCGGVELVEQGHDRLGLAGVAGGLDEQGGELFRAEVIAAGREAAQVDHGLRDVEAEPDRQRGHVPGDDRGGGAPRSVSRMPSWLIVVAMPAWSPSRSSMSRARWYWRAASS